MEESKQGAHHPHDKAYKFLLSSRKLFAELLHSFVERGWVDEIDESQLMKVDKSYILQDFREREADLVYRMEWNDRQIIFYVLMEMQSVVDFQMPYRLLLYMVEIWRDVLKNTEGTVAARKHFKLPAIVPIVLYNGASPWTACRSFRETLSGEEWFGDELLDFKYILIDVHRYDEQELVRLSNLIGSVFLLERKADIHDFISSLSGLTGVLECLPEDSFRLFLTWMKLVTLGRLSEENGQKIAEIVDFYNEPREARSMISNLEKAFEEFDLKMSRALQDGMAQGMAQGMAEGMAQGKLLGEKQGKMEGRQEAQEEIARRMLGKGLPAALVAEVTGLPEEAVEKLK